MTPGCSGGAADSISSLHRGGPWGVEVSLVSSTTIELGLVSFPSIVIVLQIFPLSLLDFPGW
jgi:hypothetical protein